jgi:hypothetical protein
MVVRDIVVVGGSAGSIEAVTEMARGLPPDFPGSVFVVVHFPAPSPAHYPAFSLERARFPPGTPGMGSQSSRGEFTLPLPIGTFI